MSVEYIIVNRDRKEYLYPRSVGECGCFRHIVEAKKTGGRLYELMLTQWQGCDVTSIDENDEVEPGLCACALMVNGPQKGWRDVTVRP